MYMAARLGCERAMARTEWATFHPDCMDRLRKHCSHRVEGLFLIRKTALSLSGCMTIDSADHCMLVNEGAWSKSRVCLLGPEVDISSVLKLA